MESIKSLVALLLILSSAIAVPIATSHQSFVSGDGWRYSYGIVHGPPGIGHAEGESFPHGYGGFGTYAPSYDYGHYGLTHLSHHTAVLPHPEPLPAVHKPLEPVHIGYEKPLAPLEPIHTSIPVVLPLEHEHVSSPKPVLTKPLTIPFQEYVLSSPLHHQYGVPHYGGEAHYSVPHYGEEAHYTVPHYGEEAHYIVPHHGDEHFHYLNSDIFGEQGSPVLHGYKGLFSSYGSPYAYGYGHEIPSYHSILDDHHHHH